MAGRFEGMSDAQWEAMKPFFPEPRRSWVKSVPVRLIINSILYILITGSKGVTCPLGRIIASLTATVGRR